jgi:5'-nucleotidase
MKRLCIDMDETIADTATEYLGRYNRDNGTNLTKADLLGKTFYDIVYPQHRETAKEYFFQDDFFVDLPLVSDSQRVLASLAKKYEVFIASAAMEFPDSFTPKYRWLERHFPFLDPLRFVFCGDKSILNADYLIDDDARHFKHFKGEGLLFSAPHNHGVTGYRRVADWAEVEQILLGD